MYARRHRFRSGTRAWAAGMKTESPERDLRGREASEGSGEAVTQLRHVACAITGCAVARAEHASARAFAIRRTALARTVAVRAATEVDRACVAHRTAGSRRAMVIASTAQTDRAVAVVEAAGLTGLRPIAGAVCRIGIADRGPRRGGVGVDAGAVRIGRAGLCGGEADTAEARKARRGASRARLAVGKRLARSVEAARSAVRRAVRGARAGGPTRSAGAGRSVGGASPGVSARGTGTSRSVRSARAGVSARLPGPAGAAPLEGFSGSRATARAVPSEAGWPKRLGAAARTQNDRCN